MVLPFLPHPDGSASPRAAEPSDLSIALLRQMAATGPPQREPATVPLRQAGAIDAAAAARWIGERYPRRRYAAAVVGSPHGGAAHLAAGIGGLWLPGSFGVRICADRHGGPRPPGAAAADAVLRANRNVRLYETLGHDARERSTDLSIKWTTVPAALRRCILDRLAPGSPIVVVADCRTRPTSRAGDRHLVQHTDDGSPAPPADTFDFPASTGITSGFMRTVRRWATLNGYPVRTILITEPAAFSAAVAEVYRRWLSASGIDAHRLVVQTGDSLDTADVLGGRLVPYWCAGSRGCDLDALEWWLAGSPPFASIDVLTELPAFRLERTQIERLSMLPLFAGAGGWRHNLGGELRRPLPPLPWRDAFEVIERYASYGGLLAM